MGKRYADELKLVNPIQGEEVFKNFLKEVFDGAPEYLIAIQGFKAIIRYRVFRILPEYAGIVPGFRGPELQSVITYLPDKQSLYITTEYGFRHSGSDHRQGTAGHRQIMSMIREAGSKNKDKEIPEPKEAEEEKPNDIASQILAMKNLMDQGVITPEEFEQFKKKLLS